MWKVRTRSDSRFHHVNGDPLAPNQRFSATSGWTNYQTVGLPCSLPAGHSAVLVSYDSSLNSSNSLNLDNLSSGGPAGTAPDCQHGTELIDAGRLRLTFNSTSGQRYRVQVSPDLLSGGWSDLGIPITASNATVTVEDSVAGTPRYYRIVTP